MRLHKPLLHQIMGIIWALTNGLKKSVKSYEKQGFSTVCVSMKVLPLYFAIHHHYPLIPVEPTTVSCIKRLQTISQVMSLTARSPQFSARTLEQLHAIDFILIEHQFMAQTYH